MRYYCIDFFDSKIIALNELEVFDYDQDEIDVDLRAENLSNPLDLTDYDRVVFDCEKKADEFLSVYKKTFKSLDNSKICKDRNLPAMLYKRRYIVQSIMGFKMQTYRKYKKDWKIGQIFNLHDQTYFLTVRLTDLYYCNKKGAFCYKFDLA